MCTIALQRYNETTTATTCISTNAYAERAERAEMTSQAKRLGSTEMTALELCSLATEGTQEITEIDFLTEMKHRDSR